MPLILSGNVATATAATGYNLANSCRFNDDDNPSLKKTPSGAGSLTNWTFSCWVKRSTISNAQQMIAMALASSGNDTQINFSSGDQIEFFNRSGGSVNGMLLTNRKFRDVSAWYHIVAVWNSDDATAGNRMRLYINGTEETSFATDTNPNQNTESKFNSACEHVIGQANSGSADFDGYLAEVVYIDGQALTPSSFGEFNSDSPRIWQPVDVSGLTFGTNGFYLDFEDSSNLGNDIADNGDWTEANLAAIDQTTDTPTNNFCTLNPLIYTPNPPTFSEGNTKFVKSTTGVGHGSDTIGTMGVKSGKWYWEMKTVSSTSFQAGMIGDNHNNANSNGDIGGSNIHIVIPDNTWGDNKNNNGTTTSITLSYSANDIFGFAHDLDNGKWYFHINGTYHDSGDPTSGSSGTGSLGNITTGTLFYLPYAGGGSYNHQHTFEFNFGNAPFSISSGNADANGYGNFEYAVPSGYYALCTKNLAEYG